MSVQVKTPSKTRFEDNTQILCGDKSFSSPESFRRSKDDLSIRNETRFSQAWNRKRRFSQSGRREEGAVRRKRLRSTPVGPLPNRFLNGGSIDDPLNLNGLDSSELGKQLNSITPQSSPLPTPVRRQAIEVRLPLNISDPLNLDNSDDEADLEKMLRKKKQRNRHHKKKDEASLILSPQKNVNMDKSLMEALKIDIQPEQPLPEIMPSLEFQKHRPVCDKIVSPVIRQVSPKSKKRRRTNSGSKPEPSSSVSRVIPTSSSTISPTCEKKSPMKKTKQQRLSLTKSTDTTHKSDKTRGKFIYGNYNRYYGYRNPLLEDDKRLDCFRKDWFEGKCVLDIGCNVGQLTLAIARDFHPSKVVGIDIDAKLITAARKNIRHYMSHAVTDTSKYPISSAVNYGPIVAPPVAQKDVKRSFPNNVLFMQGNYVLESDELLDLQKEEHDVILALSVTKWVHFNWGDIGLKRFFKRVYKQLRPGGIFILEPQPWSSYKKKKKLTETIAANYQNIQLRPEQFIDYLLSREVGFSTCNTLDVPFNASKGFRRPVILFTKSDTVQNSPWSGVGNATPNPGNVTPVQSSHPAVYSSTLSHISEDSSCSTSCSSVDKESMDIDIHAKVDQSTAPVSFNKALDDAPSASANITDSVKDTDAVPVVTNKDMEETPTNELKNSADTELAVENVKSGEDNIKSGAESVKSDLKTDESKLTETGSK